MAHRWRPSLRPVLITFGAGLAPPLLVPQLLAAAGLTACRGEGASVQVGWTGFLVRSLMW